MSNQQFYKSFDEIETTKVNENSGLSISHLLSAKMAREITNQTILEKLHRLLENDVKPIAKEGLSEYKFSINKKYEIDKIIQILKDLEYKVTILAETSDKAYIKIKW